MLFFLINRDDKVYNKLQKISWHGYYLSGSIFLKGHLSLHHDKYYLTMLKH